MRIERINCNFICSRRKQERVLVGISGVKSHIFFVPFPHIIYRENEIFPLATICCGFFSCSEGLLSCVKAAWDRNSVFQGEHGLLPLSQ